MSLFKGANGLPRFMVDCGFWRHPKWQGQGQGNVLDQMGLYVACISYCYEHETDGILPGPDAGDLGVALGIRGRFVKPALEGLVTRGSVIAHPDRLEVRSFISHNPTRADIEQHRQKRSAAGKKAAAARWPGKNGAPPASESDSESECESHSESDATRNTSTHSLINKELVGAQKPKRAHRLPDDYPLTGELEGWARGRCPGVDVVLQHEKFCNHWWSVPPKKATKTDWQLAERNWMLTSFEQLPEHRKGKPTQQPLLQAVPDPPAYDDPVCVLCDGRGYVEELVDVPGQRAESVRTPCGCVAHRAVVG